MLGRVVSTVFLGDEACSSSSAELQQAVTEFNATLARFGHTVTFLVYKEMRGTVEYS
jgi:hypothetical protein